MSTSTEAKKLLNQLDELRNATDDLISVRHLSFLLLVYLAGDGGTTHEEFVRLRFPPSVVSRLMQDFTKVRYNKREPGYDLITVENDPMNLRRKIIRMNQRGQKILDRILSR